MHEEIMLKGWQLECYNQIFRQKEKNTFLLFV